MPLSYVLSSTSLLFCSRLCSHSRISLVPRLEIVLISRIVVLDGGRVEQIGKPLELYNQPSNVFVASFIGSPRINLIRLSELVELQNVGKAVIPEATLKTFEDKRVEQIGFRPEMVKAETQVSANDLLVHTVVSHMEQLGSEAYIYLETDHKINFVMHNQGQQHFELSLIHI